MELNLSDIFQLTPIPPNVMTGYYNWYLVGLSYLIASLASFVALDTTEIIRRNGVSLRTQLLWILIGAFTLGLGVWTMHFIGMLAFVMPMPMDYEPFLTTLSMLTAMVAAALAFILIKNEKVKLQSVVSGGILIGLGIVAMHYMGMSAMNGVKIHYRPGLFILSVMIAIVASEAALWLMIKGSNLNQKYHRVLKIVSSLIMGVAICGMHYTGMAAAVFEENMHDSSHAAVFIDPKTLSFYLAGTFFLIISIALVANRFWLNVLWKKNQTLIEAEAALEQKSKELQQLNESLLYLAEKSVAKEEKITAILNAAGDGMIVGNEAGVIEIGNKMACKILGFLENEILFNKIEDHFGINLEGQFQHVDLPFLLENRSIQEWIAIGSKKQHIPIELTISKSIIGNKNLCIINFRDITERKQSEENLNILNQKLVTTARFAGMAEVAACVLHNIGNVLNSINVSSQVLIERSSHSKIEGLKKVAELITENQNNLEHFFINHPIGNNLAKYLNELGFYWEEEENYLHAELLTLNSKIQHVKNIIVMQQMLSCNSNIVEKVQVNSLLDDALSINIEAINSHQITVKKEYAKIPLVELDKVKFLQILVNLIKNAIEAITESQQNDKKITISTKTIGDDSIGIEIIDNGIGIPKGIITKIFTYGFTTKKSGHGFGLHSAALSVQEMGGSLKAHSQGVDQGATFEIILPKNIATIKEEIK